MVDKLNPDDHVHDDDCDCEEDVVVLVDEEGNEERFSIIDIVEKDDKKYAILVPEDDEEDEGMQIFRIEEDEDGEESLVFVDDDDEAEGVIEILDEMMADEEFGEEEDK